MASIDDAIKKVDEDADREGKEADDHVTKAHEHSARAKALSAGEDYAGAVKACGEAIDEFQKALDILHQIDGKYTAIRIMRQTESGRKPPADK